MLTVEEALELIAKNAEPLAPRRMPLNEVAGLVLGEDVTSDVNSPPYDKALMDGYAIRSGEREPERQVVEEVAAGAVPHFPVTPGTASRIMTGAPLPEGSDAVVPIERTELLDGAIVRLAQVDAPPGQNVLPLGTSMRAGDTVLREGALLRPIEIAILAEIGRTVVKAIPRPRVAILPTGNELVAVSEKPGPGQIRNSNGPMLKAAIVRAGAEVIELDIARDDRDELTRAVEGGLAADILVLSGGVSAGKFDLVPEVLESLGVEQVLHKVALRPGKPLWFGIKRFGERRALVFGLPGNPVSSFVCFELFVRPAISTLAGAGFTGLPSVQAQLVHGYEHAGGRAAYLPACVKTAAEADGRPTMPSQRPAQGPLTVEILPWHGSADLATLARANGLVRLSAEKRQLTAGTILDVLQI